MFHIGIMGRHVFPGIDFQQWARIGLFVRWPIVVSPRQPPVIDIALLLAANFTMKSLSPRHREYFQLKSSRVYEVAKRASLAACSRAWRMAFMSPSTITTRP